VEVAAGRQVPWLMEAAGYVGGGLMAGGMALVLGARWEELTREGRGLFLGGLAVLFVIAGVLVAGGRPVAIGRGPANARRRVVGVLLSSAAVPLSFAIAAVAPDRGDDVAGLAAGSVLALLAVAAVSTPFGVTMLAVMSLGTLGTGLDLASPGAVPVALGTIAAGLAWCAASALRAVRPRALGLAVGAGTALVGAQLALDGYDWLAYLLTALVAAGAFVLYHWVREIVLLIAGVVGLTVVVPEVVNDLSGGAVEGASVLIVGGAVLIAASALGLRLRKVERSG
jgi:hypothetical protein